MNAPALDDCASVAACARCLALPQAPTRWQPRRLAPQPASLRVRAAAQRLRASASRHCAAVLGQHSLKHTLVQSLLQQVLPRLRSLVLLQAARLEAALATSHAAAMARQLRQSCSYTLEMAAQLLTRPLQSCQQEKER